MSERKRMEDIIRSGRSVVHNGAVYSNVESLPDEADLVSKNPALAGQTEDSLQSQIAALQAQLKKVQGVSQTESKSKSESTSSEAAGAENKAKK